MTLCPTREGSMPNTRVMLWAALAAMLYLNYDAWMKDYPASAPGSGTGLLDSLIH